MKLKKKKKHSTKTVALNRTNRIHEQTEKCKTKTKWKSFVVWADLSERLPEWLRSIISVTVSDSEQGNELVYMNWFCVCFGVGVVRMKEQGEFWFIELLWVTTKNEGIDNIREIWISRGRTKRLLRIFESFEKANWPYKI